MKDDKKIIYVYLDNNRLWTADLYDDNMFVANLGGSYPKSNSTVLDAKKTWGRTLEITFKRPVKPLPPLLDVEIPNFYFPSLKKNDG